MSEVDALLAAGSTSRGRGCFVCGRPNAAYLMVRLQRVGENGQNLGTAGSGISKSRSFCDEHAVEFWRELSAKLEAKP